MVNRIEQLVCLVLLVSMACAAKASSHFTLEYQSRYITEGRNNLQSGGIFLSGLETDLTGSTSINVNYGLAQDKSNDYDELETGITYTTQVNGLIFNWAITHLSFPRQATSDTELSLGMDWALSANLSSFANLVHSFAASGRYLELGLLAQTQLTNHSLVSATILAGFDDNYLSSGGSYYDHLSIRLKTEHSLSAGVLAYTELSHHFAYSESAKTETLSDSQTSFNIGFVYSF